MECFICLNNIEKNEKFSFLSCKCNNSYHDSCIKKWLIRNPTCPICKFKWIPKPLINMSFYVVKPEPDVYPNYYKCAQCDNLYKENWLNNTFRNFDDIIEVSYKNEMQLLQNVPLCTSLCYNRFLYRHIYSLSSLN